MATKNKKSQSTTDLARRSRNVGINGLNIIVRRATKLAQNTMMPLFQFALTSEELLAVADFSRLSRDDTGKLLGYQRPEVKKHIEDITDYLNGESPLFPHPIIIAFSSRVSFTSSRGPNVH